MDEGRCSDKDTVFILALPGWIVKPGRVLSQGFHKVESPDPLEH
jgi:hypothetical protein